MIKLESIVKEKPQNRNELDSESVVEPEDKMMREALNKEILKKINERASQDDERFRKALGILLSESRNEIEEQ